MSQPTITPPQVQGLPLGATSERNAAMVTQQQDADNLNALNNITTGKVGGRRRKRRVRGREARTASVKTADGRGSRRYMQKGSCAWKQKGRRGGSKVVVQEAKKRTEYRGVAAAATVLARKKKETVLQQHTRRLL